ncbi:hypothetical protein RI578_06505 [Streptomyces sp. BB1-1-1]|uniref:hypothetical protein n=1 Tax=Streptomyces sp. BB1-1-1 TaxID=3074430 RepID=UPI002877448D|nr:hypothetical protein [Streptomyces sp. BB1-1-1]WND33964.1 hypothetical protein RI578_06505 [Streptomyces sp. BB1-1-1]
MARTPEQVTVRVDFEAQLSVIRPGDTVLVRVARDTPPVQLERLADRLRERLPSVEVLLLAGVDGIDVYRPGEAGGPDGWDGAYSEGSGEAPAP